MKLLLVCCLTLLAASPTLSKCLGSINVREYGEVFIVAPDWSAGNIDIHDNGFTLRGNSRLYFASSCEDGWNNGMYAQMNLNGKRFAYTLDIVMLDAIAMLLLTLLTCLATMVVKMVTTTVMPTMVVESGVLNMMCGVCRPWCVCYPPS